MLQFASSFIELDDNLTQSYALLSFFYFYRCRKSNSVNIKKNEVKAEPETETIGTTKAKHKKNSKKETALGIKRELNGTVSREKHIF